MIVELVRDAVRIKIKAQMESPLISVYEFCYAAGLGLAKMAHPKEQAMQMIAQESFADFKSQVQKMVKESGVFEENEQDIRLKSLIAGCRVRGEFSEEARTLFQMGLSAG